MNAMIKGALALLQLASTTPLGPAEAGEPPSARPDTTYGRIDGDVGLVAGLGVAVGPHDPRAAAELRVRYLEVAGLWGTYEDGALLKDAAEPVRVLAGGIELRPLFLARWLKGREFGVPRLDLVVDSLALEIGGAFAQAVGGSFGDRPGLQVGLGLELPFLAQASGPWIGIHGGMRWSDAVLGGGPVLDSADRALFLSVTLSWHQIVGAHAVDVFDRAPR
jgi:hypothetical protein